MKTIQEYGVNAPQSITTDFFPGVRFMAAPLFNLFSGGGLEQTPWNYDFHATAVWSKGRHNLQFGIDTQYDRLYVLDASFTVGTWTYNGSRTGYLPADIMMGLPSSFVQDSGRTLDLAEWKNHFWIQDDWKVNDRLTVNAGLRWEPWTPPTDSLNNLVGFVKGQQSTVAPDAPLGMVYPGDAGIPESLFSNNYGLFAPRIGAAYDLFGNAQDGPARRLRHLLRRPRADHLHAHGEHPAERARRSAPPTRTASWTRTTASRAATPTRSRGGTRASSRPSST